MQVMRTMHRLVSLFLSSKEDGGPDDKPLFDDEDDGPPPYDRWAEENPAPWLDDLPQRSDDGAGASGMPDDELDLDFLIRDDDPPRPEDGSTEPQQHTDDHESPEEVAARVKAMVESIFPDRQSFTKSLIFPDTPLGRAQTIYLADHDEADKRNISILKGSPDGISLMERMKEELRYVRFKQRLVDFLVNLRSPHHTVMYPNAAVNEIIRQIRPIRLTLDRMYNDPSSADETPISTFISTCPKAQHRLPKAINPKPPTRAKRAVPVDEHVTDMAEIKRMLDELFPARTHIPRSMTFAGYPDPDSLIEYRNKRMLEHPPGENSPAYKDWKTECAVSYANARKKNPNEQIKFILDTEDELEKTKNTIALHLAQGVVQPHGSHFNIYLKRYLLRLTNFTLELDEIYHDRRPAPDTTHILSIADSIYKRSLNEQKRKKASTAPLVPKGTTPNGATLGEIPALLDEIFPGRLAMVHTMVFPNDEIGLLRREYIHYRLQERPPDRSSPEHKKWTQKCGRINVKLTAMLGRNDLKTILDNEDAIVYYKQKLTADLQAGVTQTAQSMFNTTTENDIRTLIATKQELDRFYLLPSAVPDVTRIRAIRDDIYNSRHKLSTKKGQPAENDGGRPAEARPAQNYVPAPPPPGDPAANSPEQSIRGVLDDMFPDRSHITQALDFPSDVLGNLRRSYRDLRLARPAYANSKDRAYINWRDKCISLNFQILSIDRTDNLATIMDLEDSLKTEKGSLVQALTYPVATARRRITLVTNIITLHRRLDGLYGQPQLSPEPLAHLVNTTLTRLSSARRK